MKIDIYKEYKINGAVVIYEKDSHNVYDKHGNFMFVGSLDGNKLTRAKIITGGDGKAIEQIVKPEPAKEEEKS